MHISTPVILLAVAVVWLAATVFSVGFHLPWTRLD